MNRLERDFRERDRLVAFDRLRFGASRLLENVLQLSDNVRQKQDNQLTYYKLYLDQFSD